MLPLGGFEVGQDLGGVAGGVGHLVALHDRPFGIDQVAHPLGEVGELVARVPGGFVGRAHRLVGVAQQSEREVELVAEGLVVGRRVERDAEDVAVQFGEALGLVTQALSLKRSTGCVGLGIPPQQYPVAPLRRQRERLPVVVGDREVGG